MMDLLREKMHRRKTATYKNLTDCGRTVRIGLFSSSTISSQMEMQMVNGGWER